nr:immunoglobulin heavy chain junction region [Mus musculus]
CARRVYYSNYFDFW